LSVKLGNEEFTEFSDLYDNPDFLTIEEREEVEKELKKISKIIEARANA
jgi:hypothetical protein